MLTTGKKAWPLTLAFAFSGNLGIYLLLVASIRFAGAPVATPLAWDELDDDALTARSYTIRDVPDRLREHGDPWADIAAHATGLSQARKALSL